MVRTKRDPTRELPPVTPECVDALEEAADNLVQVEVDMVSLSAFLHHCTKGNLNVARASDVYKQAKEKACAGKRCRPGDEDGFEHMRGWATAQVRPTAPLPVRLPPPPPATCTCAQLGEAKIKAKRAKTEMEASIKAIPKSRRNEARRILTHMQVDNVNKLYQRDLSSRLHREYQDALAHQRQLEAYASRPLCEESTPKEEEEEGEVHDLFPLVELRENDPKESVLRLDREENLVSKLVPMPHQTEAIRLITERTLARTAAGIFHEPGMGKTPTTLLALQAIASRPEGQGLRAVIACPKSVQHVWIDELQKWDNFTRLKLVPAPLDDRAFRKWKKPAPAMRILVLTHDSLKTHKHHLDDECILVVDEAHIAKSNTSQLHQCISLAPTTRRVLLTGTAVQNDLSEFYALIELIDPGALARSKPLFNQIYGKPIAEPHEDPKFSSGRLHAMTASLRSCIHRAENKAIKSKLTPLLHFHITHDSAVTMHSDNKLTEHHQASRDAIPAKAKYLVALKRALEETAPDDRIIVFEEHVYVLESLQEHVPGQLFSGAATEAERLRILADFAKSPGGTVLYLTLGAGSVGLRLDACANRVVIMGRDFNPTTTEQAIHRVHRIGQTKPVVVYNFIAKGNVESQEFFAGMQKTALAHRVENKKATIVHASGSKLRDFEDARVSDCADALTAARAQPMDAAVAALIRDSGDSIEVYLDHEINLSSEIKEPTDKECIEYINIAADDMMDKAAVDDHQPRLRPVVMSSSENRRETVFRPTDTVRLKIMTTNHPRGKLFELQYARAREGRSILAGDLEWKALPEEYRVKSYYQKIDVKFDAPATYAVRSRISGTDAWSQPAFLIVHAKADAAA